MARHPYLLLSLLCLVPPLRAQQPERPKPQPSARLDFEVATIKPPADGPHMTGVTVFPGGRVKLQSIPLKGLISIAYGLSYWQITGGERWLAETPYDIEAKAPPEAGPYDPRFSLYAISDPRLRQMLQALLEDRFHLHSHRESAPGTVSVLERSRKPLLWIQTHPNPDAPQEESGERTGEIGYMGRSQWIVTDTSTAQLAKFAGDYILHHPVRDATGLSGYYDYRSRPAPEDEPQVEFAPAFQMMLEQAGFTLRAERGAIEHFVIDSAEKPTAN